MYRCPVPSCSKKGSTGTSSAPSPDTSGAYEGAKANVKHHISRVHNKDKPYPCTWPGCPQAFAQQSNLTAHLLAQVPWETSPTSARPTSPSARRRTRPSMRCWTTSPPGTTVSRSDSARMPSVGSGSTAAGPGRCMCGRRTRGRRGRVRSSGVMCRVTAPQPEPTTC